MANQKAQIIDAVLAALFSGTVFFLYLFFTSGGDDMSWAQGIIMPALILGVICGTFDFVRSNLKRK